MYDKSNFIRIRDTSIVAPVGLTSFLISKKGRYINGTNIVVDGGYSCGAFMGV